MASKPDSSGTRISDPKNKASIGIPRQLNRDLRAEIQALQKRNEGKETGSCRLSVSRTLFQLKQRNCRRTDYVR
jgi:hypothetical protein